MLKVKIFFQKEVLHLSVGQEILTNTLSLGKILWENLVVDFVIIFSIILERTWGTIWNRNILLAIFPIRVISVLKFLIPTMPWLDIKRNVINIRGRERFTLQFKIYSAIKLPNLQHLFSVIYLSKTTKLDCLLPLGLEHFLLPDLSNI